MLRLKPMHMTVVLHIEAHFLRYNIGHLSRTKRVFTFS